MFVVLLLITQMTKVFVEQTFGYNMKILAPLVTKGGVQ